MLHLAELGEIVVFTVAFNRDWAITEWVVPLQQSGRGLLLCWLDEAFLETADLDFVGVIACQVEVGQRLGEVLTRLVLAAIPRAHLLDEGLFDRGFQIRMTRHRS